MTPTETILLLIGLAIGCVILAHLLSIGAFNITKKQPPAVRLHPELLSEWRSEIHHAAVKRMHDALKAGPKGARPGYQRSNFR